MARKLLLIIVPFLFLAVFPAVNKAHAATLSPVSDRISTSRPSASAPLILDQTTSHTYATITDFNDNIMYLASDSAILFPDTGQTLNTMTVASASAADTPASNQRRVFFTSAPANTHHIGTALVTPISAMHTIAFNTPNAVPTSGQIVLTFPALTSGDANNPASPSATTFQMNGLSTTQIVINGLAGAATFTTAITNPTAGTSPIVTITLTGTTNITAGSSITVLLGCTVQSGGACTTSSPRIINPTQGAIANGTSRNWTLNIETQDSSSLTIDSAKVRISTIDAVLVQGTVDPSLTVTIAGVTDGANFNVAGNGGCAASEVSNSGLTPTATSVNLGVLGTGISLAGQVITVGTNAQFGYAITATSSGRFIDPSTGFWITDVNGGDGLTANNTPAPAALTAGTPAFGLFPCGARPPTSSPDYNDESAVGSGANGTNPWNTGVNSYYATIANYTAPVATDRTGLRYAATVSALTPAGVYFTIFTYVVTATF